jgi:lambda family phage portal protein
VSLLQRASRAAQAFRAAFSAAKNPAGRPMWNPQKGGPNAATGPSALTIAARARDAVRNNPYAARIVDVWAANAVGTGITTRWEKGSPQEAAWSTWSEGTDCDAEGAQSWAGLQELAFRAVVESGEALIRFVQVRPSRDNPVGLVLLLMEGDRLDWSFTGMHSGNRVVQGIEVNSLGRPLAYHLLPPDDVSWLVGGQRLQRERVPAQDIIHLFRRRRPGQMRDVSWLAPVLWPLRDLSQYEAALLRKAEIEACLSVVISDDSEEAATGSVATDAFGTPIESLQPGMILYRRGAGDVEVVNPSGGGSHAAFAKRHLEQSAAGAGLTYDQISGDLTNANYSSMRAGKIEFWQLLGQVQYNMLVPNLCARVARRFQDAGWMAGLWRADMPKVSHVPPAPAMVQPLDDTRALIEQIRAGFVPPQDGPGQFGYAWNDVIDETSRANADRDAARVIHDSDPRRTAGTGGAQSPAQNAAVELGGGRPRPPAA